MVFFLVDFFTKQRSYRLLFCLRERERGFGGVSDVVGLHQASQYNRPPITSINDSSNHGTPVPPSFPPHPPLKLTSPPPYRTPSSAPSSPHSGHYTPPPPNAPTSPRSSSPSRSASSSSSPQSATSSSTSTTSQTSPSSRMYSSRIRPRRGC